MQFGKIDGCQNLGFLASTDEDYSASIDLCWISNSLIFRKTPW